MEVTRRARLVAAVLWAFAATTAAQGTVLVEEGTACRYVANVADPGLGLDWTAESFDDSGWTDGVFGLGYDEGSGASDLIATAVPIETLSVYARTTFDIPDVAAMQTLLIAADWDDGWAAWINGVEVHRSPEMPGGDPDWDTDADLHESSNGADPTYLPLVDITAVARPMLRDGTNVLAVGAWNGSPPSSDLVLVPYLVLDPPADVVRGPYLQSAAPDAMTVRWRTGAPISSRVEHGTSPGVLDLVFDDGVPKLEHEVRLTGLQPETRYWYSVDGTEHSFRTPPPVGTRRPVRAWVIGDSGTGIATAEWVRDAWLDRHAPEMNDLWIMLGDNAYDDGTDPEYQRAVFRMYPQLLPHVPLWPTLGNHDARSADSADESGVYYDIFTLPRAGESGGLPSGTEAYYSFDVANVHFICLDSQESDREPTGAMLTWLAEDLADTLQEWVIAFWHHPPYSKGSHDSDDETRLIDMREKALPILEAAGVDLVLSGHSHSYERSYLIDQHYGDSSTFGPAVTLDGGDGDPFGDGAYAKPTEGIAPHEGAVYAVAGSSGLISPAFLDHPAMLVGELRLGSMEIEVNGLRLDARFIDDDGDVHDAFTIVKGCVADPCVEIDCADGLDDDGDGAVDLDDPDCIGLDRDGDGRGDGVDCAPEDPGSWDPAPSAATLRVVRGRSDPIDRGVLRWPDRSGDVGPDLRHDVIGGRIVELWASESLADASCLSDELPGGVALHDTPAGGPQDGWWYVVRAANGCGDAGGGVSSIGARSLPPTACD